MKVISLWQIWASLIEWSDKEYETRSWGTSYRGPLVIHAAKNQDGLRDVAAGYFSVDQMGQKVDRFPIVKFSRPIFQQRGIKKLSDLPLGMALCVVDLVDCIKMTDGFITSMTDKERAFGNWEPGRYAWKLANPRSFSPHIPIRGAQGLFDAPSTLPRI